MSAYKEGDPTTLNRLYGRSAGKPLRPRQQGLVDELLPKIAVPTEGPVTAERLFGEDCPLHFEIGFGAGEHLAYRADLLPNHGLEATCMHSVFCASPRPTYALSMAIRAAGPLKVDSSEQTGETT